MAGAGDITDKTQLEWREVFQDLNHQGFITAEKWSGWEIWSARNVIPSPDLHTGSADAMPEMWS